jgi:hypothetical protein
MEFFHLFHKHNDVVVWVSFLYVRDEFSYSVISLNFNNQDFHLCKLVDG